MKQTREGSKIVSCEQYSQLAKNLFDYGTYHGKPITILQAEITGYNDGYVFLIEFINKE